MAFVEVVKESEVQEGRMKTVKANGQEVVLTRVEGKPCAFANACPHLSGPLGEGEVENGVVTCPLHGARFDVRSGANVGPTFGGEKVSPIRVFAAKAENGAVFVDV